MKDYSEIKAENDWLRGCLRELRKEKAFTDRVNYMLSMLFSATGLLLILICSGAISV